MPVIQTIDPMGPLDVAVLLICLALAAVLFTVWTLTENGREG